MQQNWSIYDTVLGSVLGKSPSCPEPQLAAVDILCIVYPPAQSSHDTFITGSHLRHLTTSQLQMPSPAATAQLASLST